jgi:tRNA threonylcarbamoyladenosine biosynthesis protein TsaB
MALLLHIDTAQEEACVSISENDDVIEFAVNEKQSDHASWLHPAIAGLFEKSGKSLKALDAVSVIAGPGSYTGLRVGMSAAKGFCFALQKPLITIGTLPLLFSRSRTVETTAELFCPMIDARRSEVFTALYNKNGEEILPPHARILDEHSFDDELKGYKILFLGNGSDKFQLLKSHPNAIFQKFPLIPGTQAALAWRDFIGKNFVGLAYVEPMYIKEFYTKKGH